WDDLGGSQPSSLHRAKRRAPACPLALCHKPQHATSHSTPRATARRSPVCARSWITRALDCLKPLPQSGQTKGRSPVCTRSAWRCSSLEERLKRLPQSSQRKGRSSWRLKEAWQRSQRKGRSSLCTTSWLKSSQARLKAFSQTPHWKGFSSTITSRISSSPTLLAPRFEWAGSPTAATSSSSPTALPSTSLAVE
uniref:Uncharacterized protein n=1 Tax=Athene cunicularia TaxID=194338 RepID=A0A663MWZ9_ATHCN